MQIDREKLAAEIDLAEWRWLLPHLKRGALIAVAPGLDLVEAAAAVAADDTATVAGWIAAGQLSKPSREQIEAWNADPTRQVAMLIVQPWVLIQETTAKE
jgi:hypothetical protein